MHPIRRRTFELLDGRRFEDRESRRCDYFLIGLISLNVLATVLESVDSIGTPLRGFFRSFEIFSVSIFSAEYLARLWTCVESDDERYRHPFFGRLRYAVSVMALIDLLAVLPAYLAAFMQLDLRFLRVLRILRIFKLSHFFSALNILLEVVRVERHAFGASFFLLTIGMLFASSGIYLFEHEAQPTRHGDRRRRHGLHVARLRHGHLRRHRLVRFDRRPQSTLR